MPYWVEQTKGQHKADIDNAREMYRKGIYTVEDAWSKMQALYLVTHPTREPPALADHEHNTDYMLLTWFPLYANMWFEDTERKCRQFVRQMNDWQSTYQVCYEY